MLVRLGLNEADVQIDLSSAGGGMDDGCGGGFWCPACRAEIRAEAFAWLHALSDSYPMGPSIHAPWQGPEEAESRGARPRGPADWPTARSNGVYEMRRDPRPLSREP